MSRQADAWKRSVGKSGGLDGNPNDSNGLCHRNRMRAEQRRIERHDHRYRRRCIRPTNGRRAHASVAVAYAPTFGAEHFAGMDPGDNMLVFMQAWEPYTLFCCDEADGESFRACQQLTETLYTYADEGGGLVPQLAVSCEPNERADVWTFHLHQGVLFHDGSILDANDVVFNW